jgi:TonB family protein
MAVLRNALDDQTHSTEGLLQAIADTARVLTDASGIAIALPTEGVVVCRARSGDLAPALGSALNIESGISGECFRSSKPLRCDDAETDSHVDAEVCRMLGIRSIAVIPLRGAFETIGILEAFSGHAHAFGGEQITLLETLGEIAEAAHRKQPCEVNAIVATDPAPAHFPLRRIDVPLAARDHGEQISLAVFDEPPKAHHHYWILSGAFALLLLASGVVWWTWHEPAGETSPSQTASQAVNRAAEAASPALQVLPLKPSASITTAASKESHGKGLLQNAAKVEAADDTNEGRKNETSHSLNGTANNIKLPAPSGNSSARLAATPVPVDPPTVVLASNSGEKLPSLASETPSLPSLEMKVSQGVTAPTIIHKIEPVYPREALDQRLSGTVTLTASIAEDGTVREVQVVKGDPTLATAAVAAIRQWRYSPCLLNGKPVAVQKEITIIFKPS